MELLLETGLVLVAFLRHILAECKFFYSPSSLSHFVFLKQKLN